MARLCWVLFAFLSIHVFAENKDSVSAFLKDRPKLVLTLVIDQFRADYLTRFQSKFLPTKGQNGKIGGFNYLLDKGAWYPHGEYRMLQNMTGPGHAVILSGAYPAFSGVALNDWFDVKSKSEFYCAEDSEYSWFGSDGKKKHVGTSPKSFLGTTVGDELKNVNSGSRVVSISLKDRSSIFMGGKRADAAIWMDPARFQWTSTKYYFADGELPSWVVKINEELAKRKDSEVTPDLIRSIGLKPNASATPSLFPKGMKWGDRNASASPTGLLVTVELAEVAMKAMNLGKSSSPDLLAVSFSSHDYAGHAHGPNSPLMEEMTLADDAMISRLLTSVDKFVPGGLSNVLIVLTADHGVAPSPDWAKTAKIPTGRVSEDTIKKTLDDKLVDAYGKVSGGWVTAIHEMNVYLNEEAARDKKLDFGEVQETAKAALKTVAGVREAFTATDVKFGRFPQGIPVDQIRNSYVPGRSGDVVGVIMPFYLSSDIPASHETGYSYDRMVPIVLVGKRVRPGIFATHAEVADIAPTLSFLLGVLQPANSQGRVLSEAVLSAK